MASRNTRLNIKKLDGNIVEKHGGSKQVVFKQLGPCVETGVYEVHDEKLAQRRLEDKQPGERTNTDCLVKEQEKEYQAGWKIKMGNVLDFCNQRSTQQCTKSGVAKHLGVVVIQQQNVLVKETNVTLLAKVRCFLIQSGLSKVRVQCRCCKELSLRWNHKRIEVEPHGIVDHVVGSQEVKNQDLIYYHSACDRERHLALKLFSYKEDSNEAAFIVAVVENIYAHESLTFNNIVACEVILKWKAGLKDDMDARSDVYVLNNGCRKCSENNDGYYLEYTPGMFIHLFLYIDDMAFSCGCKVEIWVTKGLLVKAKGNVPCLKIIRDQSDNTLRVSQSRIHNEKLVQTLLKRHSTLSLEDSLSKDYDVEKNGKWSYIYAVGSHEYQVVCTRPDIASAGVDMLDGFDRGLQTNV
uniref:Zinc finger, CCHC-type n=1 Tax=Tanacetum cinerariifolium TaxID=118510 RepID=A0A6L2LM02_TANCI|nr:zinc finger, CCHC-type [Tanacetum cinerariifolium]